MTAINFTKATLANLVVKATQYEVRDQATPGLFIRLSPGGSKTFIYYRKIAGKVIRIKIGRFGEITIEAARRQASILNGQLVAGIQPQQLLKEQKRELTFKELFEYYYAEYALLHTKRPEDNKAALELHLFPKIGSTKANHVTKEMMKYIHATLGQTSGKAQANRVLAIASAVFNYGLKEEIYSANNPCIGVKRFKRKSRDRFLSKKELTLFFEALALENVLYQDFFKLCLFTGARKFTVLSMRYDQLDFELKRWRLDEAQSKNGDVNIYALSDAALEILERRKQTNENNGVQSPFVFPGISASGHLTNPRKIFLRVKERMGVSDFRIHDLRRTLGSYMAISNVSLSIIGKALNHKSQSSTAIYARLSQDPVLEAVNNAAKVIQESSDRER